ncbi:MAG: EAL domain-containing protein [Marmoricola sp.]
MSKIPRTSPVGLSSEDQRFRLVVEATPNAMVMVDQTGRIVLVNKQTELLFGYSRAELLSMTVEDLLPVGLRERHPDFRAEYGKAPRTRTMGAGRDLYGRRKDGSEVPVEIGLNPLNTEEGSFVLASVIDITERKRAEERLSQMIEAAPNAMVMVNQRGEIVLVNSQTEISFGYTREELLAMRVEQLIPDRFRQGHHGYRSRYFSDPDRREMGAGRELFGRRKDGSEIPIEIGLNPIQISDERLVLASIIDITERLRAQRDETANRIDQLRRSILDSLPFSIIATDPDGTIVTANPAAEKLLGYPSSELVGSPIHRVHGAPDRDQRRGNWPPEPTMDDDGQESIYQRRDGARVPVNEAFAPIQDENGMTRGFLTVAYDITKRKQAQDEVKHLAHHDVLTDLPNRTLLLEHLAEEMRRADRQGTELAVLLLDLDHFKRINDSLGHHIGDELLLQLASRLAQSVRDDDLVSRLGGDEFVIVLGNLEHDAPLAGRLEELMQQVSSAVHIHGHELTVTPSIGGALYPRDGADAATLLKNADTAMYHAKAVGRSNYQWFSAAMLDETNDKLALSSALRLALGAGELAVVYQPQIALATGEVVGVEALARWFSPQHGAVGPDRFIPIAEDSGLIGQLGEWVLRQACADIPALSKSLGRSLKVAVNVSPRQFARGDFFSTLIRAIEESDLDPHNLELEITEGILMENPSDVIDSLHSIRERGIGIVVDDFGTGFSSLAYLTRFPIDKIKIDRSFINDLLADQADAAIVDTIIVMAHTLGMSVVAEGVETAEQERYLIARRCDEVQGYRYSQGVPVGDLAGAIEFTASLFPGGAGVAG